MAERLARHSARSFVVGEVESALKAIIAGSQGDPIFTGKSFGFGKPLSLAAAAYGA